MKKKIPFDYVTIIIALTSLFLFFIRFNEIPVGVQYDQMRFVVDNQYISYGWIDKLPWRQFLYYWIHGGPFISYTADLARLTGNFTLLSTLPKFITMLYFYLGIVVLDSILRQLRFTIKQRLIFFSIFIPSGFTLLLSKYIPHVASYFLLTLVGVLVSLKIVESQKVSYSLFFLWLLVLILGTSTHILAVVAIVSSSVFITIFSQSQNIKSKVFNICLFLVVGGMVYLASILTGDSTLVGREILTVVQLIIQQEYLLAFQIALTTLSVYISPAFIVSGSFISSSGAVSSPYAWSMIKNPDMNHWVINGISAFGFLSVLVYIAPLYLNKFWIQIHKYGFRQDIFGVVLVLSYITTAIIGIYDNPSWSKLAPLLIVIPYLITIFLAKIEASSLFGRMLVICLLLANGIWNLTFMWGSMYQQHEAKKFDRTYQEITGYMSTRMNYAEDRIYLYDRRWGFYTALEYYLGPAVLDRVTLVTSMEELVNMVNNEPGRNWIITTEDDIDGITQVRNYQKLESVEGELKLTLYAPKVSERYPGQLTCQSIVKSTDNSNAFDGASVPRILSKPQLVPNAKYFSRIESGNYIVSKQHMDVSNFIFSKSFGTQISRYDEKKKIFLTELKIPVEKQESILQLSFTVKSSGSLSSMVEIYDTRTGNIFAGSRYILYNGYQTVTWSQSPEDAVIVRFISTYTDPLIDIDLGKNAFSLEKIDLSKSSQNSVVTLYERDNSTKQIASTFGVITPVISTVPAGMYACDLAYSPNIHVFDDKKMSIQTVRLNGGALGIMVVNNTSSVTFTTALFQ